MHLFKLAVTLISLASVYSVNAQLLKIAKGRTPLVDGNYIKKEWEDANHLKLSDEVTAHFKCQAGYLFIALESKNSYDSMGYVSIYISTEGKQITDLHSSARLGERFQDASGKFPEWETIFPDDRWFNHTEWISNYAWFTCRAFDCRSLRFAKAKEFQISLSKFTKKEWKLFFIYSYKSDTGWKNGQFPLNCTNSRTEGWLEIKL